MDVRAVMTSFVDLCSRGQLKNVPAVWDEHFVLAVALLNIPSDEHFPLSQRASED